MQQRVTKRLINSNVYFRSSLRFSEEDGPDGCGPYSGHLITSAQLALIHRGANRLRALSIWPDKLPAKEQWCGPFHPRLWASFPESGIHDGRGSGARVRPTNQRNEVCGGRNGQLESLEGPPTATVIA